MARNVEIKAHIDNVASLLPKAAAIATEGPIEIRQDDTFFHCYHGRLKLRTLSQDHAELIFYRRADQQGPKESFYLKAAVAAPAALLEALTLAYGQTGRVTKHRTLFWVGRTRVHLDRVEGLGHFLELEVVLADGEAVDIGVGEAHKLMERLGIEPSQLIEGAYVDLLRRPAG